MIIKKLPAKRQGAISFRLSASRFRLVGNVGKESKMTSAFDSGGQLTLMACAGSGYSSGNDFASFREESSETGNIFVIDFSDFINAESANSFAASSVAVHGSFGSFHGSFPPYRFSVKQEFFELRALRKGDPHHRQR
jgi:hypothetical protein